jgi:hypothetical protein
MICSADCPASEAADDDGRAESDGRGECPVLPLPQPTRNVMPLRAAASGSTTLLLPWCRTIASPGQAGDHGPHSSPHPGNPRPTRWAREWPGLNIYGCQPRLILPRRGAVWTGRFPAVSRQSGRQWPSVPGQGNPAMRPLPPHRGCQQPWRGRGGADCPPAAGHRRGQAPARPMTKDFIRGHLSYRFAVYSSGAEALAAERNLRAGQSPAGRPHLNPL